GRGGEGRGRPGDGPVAESRRYGLPRPRRRPDRLGPRPAPPAGGLPETASGGGAEIDRQAEVTEGLRDRGGYRIGREWNGGSVDNPTFLEQGSLYNLINFMQAIYFYANLTMHGIGILYELLVGSSSRCTAATAFLSAANQRLVRCDETA